MEELLGHPVDMALVRRELRRQVSSIFDLTLIDIGLEKVQDMAEDAEYESFEKAELVDPAYSGSGDSGPNEAAVGCRPSPYGL
jgi:hypothetical protein